MPNIKNARVSKYTSLAALAGLRNRSHPNRNSNPKTTIPLSTNTHSRPARTPSERHRSRPICTVFSSAIVLMTNTGIPTPVWGMSATRETKNTLARAVKALAALVWASARAATEDASGLEGDRDEQQPNQRGTGARTHREEGDAVRRNHRGYMMPLT